MRNIERLRHLNPSRKTETPSFADYGEMGVDVTGLPLETILVRALCVDDSLRSEGVDSDHVQALAECAHALPPIVVHRGSMRVIDGVHRMRVAVLRGYEEVEVRFFDGDERSAFVLGIELNVRHGLPVSLADRKAAAERVLGWYPDWSDRAVASKVGLSAKTVSVLRQRIKGGEVGGAVRVGRDGRARPVDRTRGRLLAGQLIRENPGLSLREIAHRAAISPETVRDVRARLARDEEPVPSRRPSPVTTAATSAGQISRTVAEVTNTTTKMIASAITETADVVAQPGGVMDVLRRDPSVRFTEQGRMLLRLLDVHALDPGEWARVADSVPTHCLDMVADAASHCLYRWAAFADRLQSRRPAV